MGVRLGGPYLGAVWNYSGGALPLAGAPATLLVEVVGYWTRRALGVPVQSMTTDKETLKTLSVSFVPHKGRAISGQVRKTIDAPYITRGPVPRERDMALEDAFASHYYAAFSSEIHFLTAIFTSLDGSALQAARICRGFTIPCFLTSSTVATLLSPCLTE
jgi:hypothetical protein